MLAKSEAGPVVIEHYRGRLAEIDKKTRRMTGDLLLIENGKRIMLEEQIAEIEAAEEVLKKLEKKPIDRSAAT